MSVSRVLIRLPNWLGDAVLALPAVGAARRHFAGAAVTLAASSSVAPLLAEQAGLEGIATLILPDRRRDQVAALKGGRFDLAILLTNSFGSAWVVRRAGVPERWGYRSDLRRWLLTRAVARPRGRVHQAEYYRQLVAGLGITARADAPRVSVTDATRSPPT